ncbi:PREDICTED: uncharacterized protein LOC106109619 [Papilio polytes]|uniref:uncharacterized protein LOC106109619 n=1 Tax=Papilio polytes TaxID=76194 RepID=UPI0006766764|nr:PREDICTED: uncharacterized protein LOC106109619 [Papilio polytes]XP_013146654.1 PREDICTED: uncharacterized protein LOC106109619 [Papilio polytes]
MASKARLINFLSEERYAVLSARYAAFHEAMNDPAQPVVRVYDPLVPNHLRELLLVREVSAELQQKKQDSLKPAAAKAVNVN